MVQSAPCTKSGRYERYCICRLEYVRFMHFSVPNFTLLVIIVYLQATSSQLGGVDVVAYDSSPTTGDCHISPVYIPASLLPYRGNGAHGELAMAACPGLQLREVRNCIFLTRATFRVGSTIARGAYLYLFDNGNVMCRICICSRCVSLPKRVSL